MRFNSFKNNNYEHVIDLNNLEKYSSSHDKRIKLVRDNRSFIDGNGFWRVYPISFSESQVCVVCPHCGEIHFHGRGKKPEYKYEGNRAPQCLENENNGYIILRLDTE